MAEKSELYTRLSDGVIQGDSEVVMALTREALDRGIDPLEVINEGFMPGMSTVGNSFAAGECFLPDLIMAGEAMTTGIAMLNPVLKAAEATAWSAGKVLLGTVEGDIHEIGKNLVGTMLTAGGFEVVDLGVDVPVSVFVEKVKELEPDLIGMSALLTTTMTKQQVVIEELIKAGLRDSVKVMVGGAPVTPEWAERIGADGYAGDAVKATTVARSLLNIGEGPEGEWPV